MSSRTFHGVYAGYLEDYLQFKRSLGYAFKSQEAVLFMFDDFVEKLNIRTVGLDRELAFEWCKKRPNESESFRYNRIRYVAGFSSFLNDMGIRSFIPQIPKENRDFVPYIFSRDEMTRFFAACDALRVGQINWKSCIISIPAIFRLMYGTGLRISEAIALLNKDVNLQENYLVIRDAKNKKEHMVPISESLSEVCKEFIQVRSRLPVPENDHFFISLNGNMCNAYTIRGWFTRILLKAGIAYRGRGKGPRLHDLRHTFAVHSLAMMAESGIDLYTSLPVLSTYLGHASLESTDRYVRLTSEMYPGLLKDVDLITMNVFPEIKADENN